MAATVANIHIGQGEVWVGGTAPTGGTDLTDPTAGTPSAVNAMASSYAAPTSGGTYVGFTNGAASLNYKPTYYMVVTEQAFSEVVTIPTNEEASLAFTMVETSYANLQTAIGQGKARTVVGPPAYDAIYVGSASVISTKVVSVLSRKRSGTGYYLATLYSAYSMEGINLSLDRRAESKIPTTMRCLADVSRPQGDQLFQLVSYALNPA